MNGSGLSCDARCSTRCLFEVGDACGAFAIDADLRDVAEEAPAMLSYDLRMDVS